MPGEFPMIEPHR